MTNISFSLPPFSKVADYFCITNNTEMEKVIHILDNYSAEGTLRKALEVKGVTEETICYPYHIYYGRIPTKSTYEACIEETHKYDTPSARSSLKEALSCFYAIDFTEFEKIVVWHSNDTQSLLFLYLMLSILSGNKDNGIIYEADLDKLNLSLYANPIDQTNQTGCYTVNDFLETLKHISPIDNGRIVNLMSRWENLLSISELSPWRFIKNGEFIIKNEDWMDETILEQLSKNPTRHKVYHDVFIVAYKLDNVVSHYFIIARIMQKAKEWSYCITKNGFIEKLL